MSKFIIMLHICHLPVEIGSLTTSSPFHSFPTAAPPKEELPIEEKPKVDPKDIPQWDLSVDSLQEVSV